MAALKTENRRRLDWPTILDRLDSTDPEFLIVITSQLTEKIWALRDRGLHPHEQIVLDKLRWTVECLCEVAVAARKTEVSASRALRQGDAVTALESIERSLGDLAFEVSALYFDLGYTTLLLLGFLDPYFSGRSLRNLQRALSNLGRTGGGGQDSLDPPNQVREALEAEGVDLSLACDIETRLLRLVFLTQDFGRAMEVLVSASERKAVLVAFRWAVCLAASMFGEAMILECELTSIGATVRSRPKKQTRRKPPKRLSA